MIRWSVASRQGLVGRDRSPGLEQRLDVRNFVGPRTNDGLGRVWYVAILSVNEERKRVEPEIHQLIGYYRNGGSSRNPDERSGVNMFVA